MGFFDTLLTAIAPERAVKRVAAQTAIRAINSGYSNYGASLHKKSMRGWMWHGGSPKEDIEDNLRVLRERSRDAYMGVPLANRCHQDHAHQCSVRRSDTDTADRQRIFGYFRRGSPENQ